MVKNTYKGKAYSYMITTNLSGVDPTYCSKIVWQGFRYGARSTYANNPTANLVLPYSIPSYLKDNVTLVETINNYEIGEN